MGMGNQVDPSHMKKVEDVSCSFLPCYQDGWMLTVSTEIQTTMIMIMDMTDTDAWRGMSRACEDLHDGSMRIHSGAWRFDISRLLAHEINEYNDSASLDRPESRQAMPTG